MQEKYDMDLVEESFQKFDDIANDLLDSNYITFDSNLKIFLNYCENDEIMSGICNQLKYDSAIFDDWWSKNDLGEIIHRVVGSRSNLPTDEKQRDMLLYQICLKVDKHEKEYFSVYYDFNNCDPDEAVSNFNKIFVNPLVMSMRRNLNKIKSECAVQQRAETYIPVQNLSIQQNFTNINGDVNTKGDTTIGDNSKIVKTESKGHSLFEILVGIVTIVSGLIGIYLFLNGIQ